MLYFIYAILFLLGLSTGSFLNVLALRYQGEGKILRRDIFIGRSHCSYCGKILKWYELMPLFSFLIQEGKCRACKKSLSFQYPFVELLTGLIFVSFPLFFYKYFKISQLVLLNESLDWYYWFLGIWIITAFVLLLAAIIDFRLRIIPNQINLFLAFLGIILIGVIFIFNLPLLTFLGPYAFLFTPWDLIRNNILINHLFAAAAGLLFFGIIIFLSRGRGMGLGDLKLAGALGLLMGWPDAILGFLLSFIIGAIWSLGLIGIAKKTLKDAVPFGPFLVIGTFITIFFGEAILKFYFQLFK